MAKHNHGFYYNQSRQSKDVPNSLLTADLRYNKTIAQQENMPSRRFSSLIIYLQIDTTFSAATFGHDNVVEGRAPHLSEYGRGN